jgi:hypothetical protein
MDVHCSRMLILLFFGIAPMNKRYICKLFFLIFGMRNALFQ